MLFHIRHPEQFLQEAILLWHEFQPEMALLNFDELVLSLQEITEISK